MDEHRLDAIVGPTGGPAWVTDLVNGDHFGGSSSGYPAVAGYPNVTVPAGAVHGLPVGGVVLRPGVERAHPHPHRLRLRADDAGPAGAGLPADDRLTRPPGLREDRISPPAVDVVAATALR